MKAARNYLTWLSSLDLTGNGPGATSGPAGCELLSRPVHEEPVTLGSPRARLLGLAIQGPPPVGFVALEHRPGVDVLYGLNGAGKTRVLDGLRASFDRC